MDQELNNAASPRRGEPPGPNGNSGRERAATASQLRAIRAIAERLGFNPDVITRDKLGVSLSALTLRQASTVIDELKARDGQGAVR